MDTSYFDVVVCGSDLAGLAAAALLGRRGLRVLVCGTDAAPATFTAGGHPIAREPAVLPPPDVESVARVLRALDYVQILRRRVLPLQPAFQLVFPRHRLDFGPDAQGIVHELEREFPREAGAITAAFARLQEVSATLDPLLASDLTLPPDGFWERREVARVDGKLPAATDDLLAPLSPAHPIRAGLTALAALTGSLAPPDVGPVAQARGFDGARRGLYRLDGGVGALRRLFLERIGSSAGEVREKVSPVELVLKRGRVAGVRIRPRDQTIGCDHLVWAGPVASLVPLCDEKAGRKLRETVVPAARPACHRYGLSLLVRREAIPEGMGPRVLAVRDPARPLLEDNALLITVGEESPPATVPVWVECLVPPAAASSGAGYLALVRARVRERLADVMPFFDRHLVVLASPHDGLPAELPPGAPPATDPVPATPMAGVLGGDQARRLLGVAGIPHDSGVKGLFLASSENLPGLGAEGQLVSAWGVTRLIAGRQPRKESGRKEILIEDP